MTELQQDLFEKQLVSISSGLDYPRTPDVAASVMKRLRPVALPRFASRRFAMSLALILVLFSTLMLIPPARAAILEFIEIGIVRIFRAEPTLVPPPNQQFPSTMAPVTATPRDTSQPLIPILNDLAGEMTLEAARQTVSYPILLPSYPPDLGLPDRVFVQDADGDMTILIWTDPQQPDQILMSLHLIPPGSWAVDKFDPALIQETTVNGQRAIWAIGPYPLRFYNGDLEYMRLIDGRVLIWAEGDVTYRLETELSLEEAVQIAESLEPIQ